MASQTSASASPQGLRALADVEGGDLGAAFAQPGGGVDEGLRALARRPASPGGERPRCAVSTASSASLSVALGRRRDDPLGVAGIGRDQFVAVPGVGADENRDLVRERRVDAFQGIEEAIPFGRSAELRDRFVGEGVHGCHASQRASLLATRSGRSSSCLAVTRYTK